MATILYFLIHNYVGPGALVCSLVHDFYHEVYRMLNAECDKKIWYVTCKPVIAAVKLLLDILSRHVL